MNEHERWTGVVGSEDYYQVSTKGQVRSLSRKVRNGRGYRVVKRRLLKPAAWAAGHLVVNLSTNNQQKVRTIHTLVLEAFVGPCPPGMEACHNDGNPANNDVTNLRWDTHANNMRDMEKHGTKPCGENHRRAKLTEVQVREIRKLYGMGCGSMLALGKRYGVGAQTICNIINRIKWKHLR